MRREEKTKNYIIIGLLVCVCFISVAFAALASTLNINGSAQIKTNSWDVHFENVANKTTTGAPTVTTEPTIDGLTTTVSYAVTLNQPGDKYSFTVDVVNAGSIDAKLSSINVGGVSTEQDVYVNYTVSGIVQDEVLAAGASKTISVSVEYDPTVSATQLPTVDQSLTLTAVLNFVQN